MCKISILLVCYNQEAYIKEAVESILRQDIPFEHEIVVADDCSTDRSVEIIRQTFAEHNRDFIMLECESNLGISKNYQRGFAACKGEYIAVLEGDDYWTNPEKTKKQVALIDQHPNASMCVALCGQKDLKTGKYTPGNKAQNENHTVIEINELKQYFHTSTFVIRNAVYTKMCDRYSRLINPDTALKFLLIHEGPFVLFNEDVSVYRITGDGLWTSLSKPQKDLFHYNLYRDFRKHHAKSRRPFYAKREIRYCEKVMANKLKTFSFTRLPRLLSSYLSLIARYDPLYPLKRVYLVIKKALIILYRKCCK